MFHRQIVSGAIALIIAFFALSGLSGPSVAQTQLLNVSYDPTRELYRDINKLFINYWKQQTKTTLTIRTSHGGSGKQARSVIDGLGADVVTLAVGTDIDEIAKATGKIPSGWQKRLPHNSTPYTSVIVFLVRKDNPKLIRDWDDLAKPNIQVITPNPKTSGGARWSYLGAWGYAMNKWHDESKAQEFLKAIFKNAPVLDTGARGATMTFAQRDIGDVLVTWENEAMLTLTEFGANKFDIVYPSLSILAEPPVTIVDGNVDARQTRKVAEAYLTFLYTPEAQNIIAKHHYRPAKPENVDPKLLAQFPNVASLTIDKDFGGWAAVHKKHFGEGGIFDTIMK